MKNHSYFGLEQLLFELGYFFNFVLRKFVAFNI